MNGPRLEITPGMRRLLDYPRFAGPARMLVLKTEYFFDDSWARAAETLGWEARSVPSAVVGGLTRGDIEKLLRALVEFRPDFILTSNYAGMDSLGLFARFFEDARIPYVSWFTDTPRMILFDRTVHCSPYAVAATWERAYMPYLAQLGFEHVFHMPLATDPFLFHGAPPATFARDLAFVGTSMVEPVNAAWEKLAHRPELVRAVHEAIDAGHVTREGFAQGVETVFDPVLLASLEAVERRNIELALVYEWTRRGRESMVRRLLPLGLEVYGDAGWSRVTPACGGLVGYFDDLASFYRATAVNVNVTSLQMRSAVNQRVFDCPAAGGFLISDQQGDLDELFEPDTEAVTYASLDELEDKAVYYLARPSERAAIVRRAQARIAAQHTHAHRLQALQAYLKERYRT